jgi:hypothetical protein
MGSFGFLYLPRFIGYSNFALRISGFRISSFEIYCTSQIRLPGNSPDLMNSKAPSIYETPR